MGWGGSPLKHWEWNGTWVGEGRVVPVPVFPSLTSGGCSTPTYKKHEGPDPQVAPHMTEGNPPGRKDPRAFLFLATGEGGKATGCKDHTYKAKVCPRCLGTSLPVSRTVVPRHRGQTLALRKPLEPDEQHEPMKAKTKTPRKEALAPQNKLQVQPHPGGYPERSCQT